MKNSRWRSYAFLGLLLATSAISVSCKKKKGDGSASPTPTATAAASPSPSASPTPGPSPVYSAGTCLPELPEKMVPIIHPGTCPAGYRRVNYEGTSLCVAISACPKSDRCVPGDAPEILMDCKNWGGDGFADNIRWGHWSVDTNYGMFYDEGRGWYDALGRRTKDPDNLVVWTYWGFTGSCPPKLCLTKMPPSCPKRTPPLARLDLKVLSVNGGTNTRTVKITPLVCNGAAGSGLERYCDNIPGAVAGCCPVGAPDDPNLEVCENDLIGENPYEEKEVIYQYENWGGGVERDSDDRSLFYAEGNMTFRVCSNPYAPNARPAITCVTRDFP